jgi:hypothetical protein
MTEKEIDNLDTLKSNYAEWVVEDMDLDDLIEIAKKILS